MQQLAISASLIGHNPPGTQGFCRTPAEWQRFRDNFAAGQYIMLLENPAFRPINNSANTLDCAATFEFLIVTKMDSKGGWDGNDLLLDNCEGLAWQIMQRIHEDAYNRPGLCPKFLSHINLGSAEVTEIGPIDNNFYGVLARFEGVMSNTIPLYDPELWN